MSMAKSLLKSVFVASLAFSLSCGAMAAEKGLVLHFTFDEGSGARARDLSGAGNDGKIVGAKHVQSGKGYVLDLKGAYVEVPDSPSLRIEKEVTIEAWIKNRRRAGCVLAKNGSSTYRQNYQFWFDRQGIPSFYLNGNGAERYVRAKNCPIDPNKWYHIVGVYDGDEVRIYYNGKLKASKEFETFTMGTYEKPLYIGAYYYEGAKGNKLSADFDGLIDDVKIYDRGLSVEEIVASYKAGMISRGWTVSTVASEFRKVDTTPPMLNLAMPAPDSTVKANATIRARFADAGSGIDISSAKILLDGKNLTGQAKVTEKGIELRPENPLEKGIHGVVVTVADKAGNVGNRLAWRFGVGTKVPLDIKLDKENGVFVVSGEPFFPVGLYCGATHPSSVREPLLAQAAAAGFNYQTVPDTTSKAGLDMMLKHGQKAVRKMNYTMWAYNKGDKSLLEEALKQKDHPAVLAWWTEFGAPRAKDITAMNPICKALRERDPEHPVLLMGCWAHAFDRLFVKSDIYWVYSYPINLTTTPARIDIMALWFQCLGPAFKSAATVGKGKPVWLVSQAFDYRINNSPGRQLIITPPDEFRPSPVELRAMNYLALAKGVRGLLFYAPGVPIKGTNKWNIVTYYSKPWNELLIIAGEVRHLSPVLAVGKPAETVRIDVEKDTVHYQELEYKGTHTLIAVNVTRNEVRAKFLFTKPVQVKALFEDRELSEKASGMADTFKPLEVHVYQWK